MFMLKLVSIFWSREGKQNNELGVNNRFRDFVYVYTTVQKCMVRKRFTLVRRW